jgi:Zn-dependent membrane protease YugP
MHPVVIVVPAAVLIFGPRAWVNHLLKKHDKNDLDVPVTARKFAREVLDREGLQLVRVESTDVGDHYDQQERVVRLARNRIDRKSLSALTTAAHEVAHALQDASDYPPFVWRTHLSKFAQFAGQVGAVMLVAVPLLSLRTQRPLPFRAMGSAVFAVMGTGLVAQLAALPSEFDASFNRAIPMLGKKFGERELKDARSILGACSMTYVAASLISVLSFWPWFISGSEGSPAVMRQSAVGGGAERKRNVARSCMTKSGPTRKRHVLEPIARQFGKPLIRCWLQLRGAM